MKSKIILAAVITALIMAGGYVERGWVDLPGTAAMLTLGVTLLLKETRPQINHIPFNSPYIIPRAERKRQCSRKRKKS